MSQGQEEFTSSLAHGTILGTTGPYTPHIPTQPTAPYQAPPELCHKVQQQSTFLGSKNILYWYKSTANIIATIWSKKARKVQQKPVYALHALLNYQTNPTPNVAIRVITGIMGLVWTYLLKIFPSLGVVITFFGNATVVLPLRLRHLKHWKRKLTPFYSN